MTDGTRGRDASLRRILSGLASLDAVTLVIAMTALLQGTTQTMYRPLIGPYAVSLGAGPFVAGLAVAAVSVAGLFLAVPAGSVAQRHGEGWLLLIGGTTTTATGVLGAMADSQAVLLLSMGIAGIATVLVALALHGLSTAPVRDGGVDTRRIATLGVAMMLGQMLGPLIGGILTDLWEYAAAFWVVAGLGLVMIMVGRYVRGTDRATAADRTEQPGPDIGGNWKRARAVTVVPGVSVALLLNSIGTLLLGLRGSLLPLYLDEIAWTASQIGLLLSGGAAIGLLCRSFFPALERRMSASTMFAVVLIFSALSLAVAVVTTSGPVIVAATWSAGALLSFTNPASLTLLSRLVPDAQRRLTLSVRIITRNGTQLVGPVTFGVLAAASSIRASFVVLTLFTAFASGAGARRLRRVASIRPGP